RVESVRHRIHGNIQGEFFSVLRADAVTDIAPIVHAERTTEPILADNSHKSSLVEQTLQVDFAILVQIPDGTDAIEHSIDRMVIGKGPNYLLREEAAEFPPPGARKARIGAASRRKKEATVIQVKSKIFQLVL